MKTEKLKILQEEAENCRACDLVNSRNKLVFGRGNPDAKIILSGEASGATEDLSGFPFESGAAAKNLYKTMDKIGLTLDDVYIMNSVQCRPPKNRKPTSQEILSCSPFFSKKLDIIQPSVIVALGSSAGEALGVLSRGASLTKERGKFFPKDNHQILLTVHPSYCIYSKDARVWLEEDLKKAKEYVKL